MFFNCWVASSRKPRGGQARWQDREPEPTLSDLPKDWLWLLAAKLQSKLYNAAPHAAACMRPPSIVLTHPLDFNHDKLLARLRKLASSFGDASRASKPPYDAVDVNARLCNELLALADWCTRELQPVTPQWQPIATAPKDGTHILGSSKYGGQWEKNGRFCVVVKWDAMVVWGNPEKPDKLGGWVSNVNDGKGRRECDCMPDCCCGDAGLYCGITHWMPLPSPPPEPLPGGVK